MLIEQAFDLGSDSTEPSIVLSKSVRSLTGAKR
jgi:hypothetical protein